MINVRQMQIYLVHVYYRFDSAQTTEISTEQRVSAHGLIIVHLASYRFKSRTRSNRSYIYQRNAGQVLTGTI